MNMTKSEWLDCDDVSLMMRFLWEQDPFASMAKKFQKYPSEGDWNDYLDVEKPLHRYYLASCRNIWKLLPQKESRKGIELAEQYILGTVNWEELGAYNWHTEGAAFCIDYDIEPEKIATWVQQVESITEEELKNILSSKENIKEYGARKLLLNAAYFADYAMIYPSTTPKGPPTRYTEFMFPNVLREYIEYPVQS